MKHGLEQRGLGWWRRDFLLAKYALCTFLQNFESPDGRLVNIMISLILFNFYPTVRDENVA